jgi:ribonuclease HI
MSIKTPKPESRNPNPASVIIHIDGGSRGNPGPAASGVVIRNAADNEILCGHGFFLGHATNNVAEYRGLIEGLKKAAELGAKKVDVVSDSELMVCQMNGQYRVKNPGLMPLFQEATQLRKNFQQFNIRHVRREQNKDADRLVNQALDLQQDVSE